MPVARSLTHVGLLLVFVLASASPAAAKTCRAVMETKSTSRIGVTEAAREKRATANAITKWRDAARDRYGVLYRFWSRAGDKTTSCRNTAKQTTCTAAAVPCRVL